MKKLLQILAIMSIYSCVLRGAEQSRTPSPVKKSYSDAAQTRTLQESLADITTRVAQLTTIAQASASKIDKLEQEHAQLTKAIQKLDEQRNKHKQAVEETYTIVQEAEKKQSQAQAAVAQTTTALVHVQQEAATSGPAASASAAPAARGWWPW